MKATLNQLMAISVVLGILKYCFRDTKGEVKQVIYAFKSPASVDRAQSVIDLLDAISAMDEQYQLEIIRSLEIITHILKERIHKNDRHSPKP